MGGSIVVESMLGRGSRFAFKLPLQPSDEGQATSLPAVSQQTGQTAGEAVPAAIIVTANTFLQNWFKSWLRDAAGHARVVGSPEAANMALVEIAAGNLNKTIPMMISWDTGSAHCIATLADELCCRGATAISLLAPPNAFSRSSTAPGLSGYRLCRCQPAMLHSGNSCPIAPLRRKREMSPQRPETPTIKPCHYANLRL